MQVLKCVYMSVLVYCLLFTSVIRPDEGLSSHDAADGNSLQNDSKNNDEENDDKLSHSTEIFGDDEVKNFNESSNEIEKEFHRQAEDLYHQGLKLINGTKRKYAAGFELLRKSAELGSSKALFELALGYLFGDYLKINFTESVYLLQRLSDIGDPAAQFYLGFIYANGLGVNSSQAKALSYYMFSATGGYSLALMTLGYRKLFSINSAGGCESSLPFYKLAAAEVASNIKVGTGPLVHRIRLIEEAEPLATKSAIIDDDLLQYYQLLAERGDVNAQYGLGQLYYYGGRGVSPNFQRALHYFSKAAEAGNMNSVAFMGKIYAEGGEGVKQNTDLALKYFHLAAEKNDPIGQSGLALLYYHGIGVPQDYKIAFKYLHLSADQNNVDGLLWLGIMYYNGEGVERDFKKAIKYFTLATQNGHALGPYYLGIIHAHGIDVLRNCDVASNLFKTVVERGRWSLRFLDAYHDYKAQKYNQALLKYMLLAELGYEVAQSNAAYLLDNGFTDLFPRSESFTRAFVFYSRGANQGSGQARVKLGDFYYYGTGMETNMEAAVAQYKLAVDVNRNPQAMFNLGYMYEKGLGLKQDVHLAKRFYDMAAETHADAVVPATLALIRLKFFMLKAQLCQKYRFLSFICTNSWLIQLMTGVLGLCIILGVFRLRQLV